MKKTIKISIILIIIFAISCNKEKEWKNVYDNNFDPKASAPTELKAEVISLTSIKVSWKNNSQETEGFKIDRQINNENWEIAFASTKNNVFEYIDTAITTNNTYTYKVYAFAGKNVSTNDTVSIKSGTEAAILTTNFITSITPTTAISGGNITDDGKATITERGVCWSTSQNPTTLNLKTNDGIGKGSFSSSITGMSIATTYYVRAYATNSLGTSYGNQLSFTTGTNLPTLTTNSITDITRTTAQSGGNITTDGGTSITNKGICWSTNNPNPSLSNSHTDEGSGTSDFISSIIGLTENTTYYVRAYATNSNGTGYGNQQVFKTLEWQCGNQITDIDGNSYNTINIGNQCWMKENLKSTHYPNGASIPLVTDNTEWENLSDNNTDDAYSFYNNNTSGEADIYGALYTYAAAIGDNWERDNTENQGICSDGWHLPSNTEWEVLGSYMGTNAGSKLAGNETLWTDGALDQSLDFGTSGYTFLPNGGRNFYDGNFGELGNSTYYWSGTEYGSIYAFVRGLHYSSTDFSADFTRRSNGYSVRCVRD